MSAATRKQQAADKERTMTKKIPNWQKSFEIQEDGTLEYCGFKLSRGAMDADVSALNRVMALHNHARCKTTFSQVIDVGLVMAYDKDAGLVTMEMIDFSGRKFHPVAVLTLEEYQVHRSTVTKFNLPDPEAFFKWFS